MKFLAAIKYELELAKHIKALTQRTLGLLDKDKRISNICMFFTKTLNNARLACLSLLQLFI